MRSRSVLRCAVVAAAIAIPCSTGFGLTISLNDIGGVTPGSQAEMGFQAAANLWEGFLLDPVTVNLDVGFDTLAPGVLGSASSVKGTVSYAATRNALAADATSADDATAVANLAAGPALNVYINRTADNPNGAGSAIAYVDSDGGANNTTIRMNKANAKALGLTGPDATPDAEITFSSSFSFDFDPTDGIDAGKIDFVGVAFHEIGHALGFVSGVDILDINSPPVNGPFNDDLFTYISPLDLYRTTADALGAGADLDWTADTRTKHFSIDGGVTSLGTFAEGEHFGDGDQASHWEDHLGLGIMDPSSVPAGQANLITNLDILAMDVIGWDVANTVVVPAPAAAWMGLVMLGSLGVVSKIRKNRREA